MKQITEDYVSFETAVLLKEKGFNILCHFNYRSMYPNAPKLFYHKSLKDFNGEEYEGLRSEWFSAPSQSLALKWLREVYHIHIKINVDSFDGINPVYAALYDEIINIRNDNFIDYGDTYEQAVEAALLYVLKNLI